MLDWRKLIPEFAGISDEASAIVDRCARLEQVSVGAAIIGPGQSADHLILPVSGTIRVQRCEPGGRRTLLYRIRGCDGHRLTTACHLSFETRSSEAVAETELELVLIPRQAFDALMTTSREFRALIFDACSKRISDLFFVIEETTANRVDARLATMLIDMSEPTTLDRARHWLSVELGTLPEVISQHLAVFERRGWVTLQRGWIELRNAAAIRELAEIR